MEFIKGHLGGNEIVLLRGEKIHSGREFEAGVYTLKVPGLRGDKAGVLHKGSGADLSAKTIDFTTDNHTVRWVTSCAGESARRNWHTIHFGIEIKAALATITFCICRLRTELSTVFP
jgi:hypothetical protein